MRLALPLSARWDVKHGPDGRVIAVLPGPSGSLPDAILTFGALIVKPDEPRLWVEQTVRSDLPRGARVAVGRTMDQTTADGWSLRLVESELTTEKGELVELRWTAFYTFLEHAAVAIVRCGARDRFTAVSQELGEVLARGRPDWRAHPLSIADAWDLEPPRSHERTITTARPAASDAFEQELARLAALPSPTAKDHVQRGIALLSHWRQDTPIESRVSSVHAALEAARSAIALDPALEAAHYLAGTVLGTLGQHADAIAAWTRALELGDRVDAHYNIAQAHYSLGDFESALRSFRAAHERDPADILLTRKIAQCLYALGRFDEGAGVRADLVRAWNASRDPRVRAVKEYVFDQFDLERFRIHAIEPLEQRTPAVSTLLELRAVGTDDRPLGASVLVETSDQARQAGTPFVIGVWARGQFKVVATLPALPPYAELRERARALLTQVIAPAAS